jgi:hypothetical protein
MRRLLDGYQVTKALYVVARLGIADLLADGPLPVADLATAANVQADALYRVLRALEAVGVFAEVAPRHFALTPLAEILREGYPGSMRANILFVGDEPYRAWADLMYSVQTGKPAFEHVFGAPHFTYLAAHSDSSAVFDRAMSGNSRVSAADVATAYPFPATGTIVDVGGGQGALIAAILQAHPGLEGILFDQAHVVAGAPPVLEEAGVAVRCAIAGGDFFTPPLPIGDIYMLRQIIHDWDDERALMILRNCAIAMRPNGRVLVIEVIITPGPASSAGKFLDLQMMVMNGGRQRTEEEYRQLFAAAGLRLTRALPTASTISVVEGVRME